jgi:hypothetical protein
MVRFLFVNPRDGCKCWGSSAAVQAIGLSPISAQVAPSKLMPSEMNSAPTCAIRGF